MGRNLKTFSTKNSAECSDFIRKNMNLFDFFGVFFSKKNEFTCIFVYMSNFRDLFFLIYKILAESCFA